jgi:predicted cupin superfamily sugar epimerase
VSAAVEAMVAALGLEPHPEGGYFRETFRSPLTVGGLPHGGPRAASTAIYYLLPAGAFSAFHRVRSDELWHFYAGDALELHTLDDGGRHTLTRLGPDVASGERPQAIVTAGVWQAARTVGARFTLCGCTVAPGFDFADWQLASHDELVRAFPAHVEIVRSLTR